MRVEWEIGIYPEMFAGALKWFGMAFKGKEPSKKDIELFHQFQWLMDDSYKQDTEEKLEKDDG